MVNKSGNIGRRGEHAAAAIFQKVWSKVNRSDVDKQHPTRDLAHTGDWHVQVKARKTWNIKDVVKHMEKWMNKPENATSPWMIIYMDSDRRKKDNPSGVYAILPAEQLARMMEAFRKVVDNE